MCGQVLLLAPEGQRPDPDGDPDGQPARPARVLWPGRSRGAGGPGATGDTEGSPIPARLTAELAEATACVGAGAYATALVGVRRLLEGVCADRGVTGLPLYRALRELRRRGVVEGRLAAWAEELREIGNEAAHLGRNPVSRQDAEDAIALADALLDHLYVFGPRYDDFRRRRHGTSAPREPLRTRVAIPETPAMKTLRKIRVPFTPHHHKHDPARSKSRKELADEMGVPRSGMLKAVVVRVDGRAVVAVAPVSAEVDVEAVAGAVGGGTARLAAPAEVNRLGWATSSEVVSPVALPYLPVVVDVSVTGMASVFVSSGRRGLELELTPADLLLATEATTARITVRGGS
ncbi:YbaK/EbsC family protein [Microtetraspora sp. NBRC 13810]|uniref:YbaK/EbsC family protein n=1 Tax=Microtetraspora sp. NBRC 13810 TaxID=3030990 RepID=UPI002552EBE0|nr:YbaK/EbsC family protein [Microtetraspora sp. NBRC 13810]